MTNPNTMLPTTVSSVGQDFSPTLQAALPTASSAPTAKCLLLEPACAAIDLQVMAVLLERSLAAQESIVTVTLTVAR